MSRRAWRNAIVLGILVWIVILVLIEAGSIAVHMTELR